MLLYYIQMTKKSGLIYMYIIYTKMVFIRRVYTSINYCQLAFELYCHIKLLSYQTVSIDNWKRERRKAFKGVYHTIEECGCRWPNSLILRYRVWSNYRLLCIAVKELLTKDEVYYQKLIFNLNHKLTYYVLWRFFVKYSFG